jgi:hypothetical protein
MTVGKGKGLGNVPDPGKGPGAPGGGGGGGRGQGKELDKLHERIRNLQLDNIDIKKTLDKVEKALDQVAQANVLATNVENGFASVIAQLQPLRDLTAASHALNEIAQAGIRNGFDNVIDELRPLRDLTEIAQANVHQARVLPGILQDSFDNVIAELRPLRDLTPQRASLEQPTADAVAGMLAAMRGVTLTGGSLGIREVNVPFIGQPPLVLDAQGQQGAAAFVPSAGQANLNQALVARNQQAFRRGIRL